MRSSPVKPAHIFLHIEAHGFDSLQEGQRDMYRSHGVEWGTRHTIDTALLVFSFSSMVVRHTCVIRQY
jgi:hypothetical protein